MPGRIREILGSAIGLIGLFGIAFYGPEIFAWGLGWS
jgi:hypothetical protein